MPGKTVPYHKTQAYADQYGIQDGNIHYMSETMEDGHIHHHVETEIPPYDGNLKEITRKNLYKVKQGSFLFHPDFGKWEVLAIEFDKFFLMNNSDGFGQKTQRVLIDCAKNHHTINLLEVVSGIPLKIKRTTPLHLVECGWYLEKIDQ